MDKNIRFDPAADNCGDPFCRCGRISQFVYSPAAFEDQYHSDRFEALFGHSAAETVGNAVAKSVCENRAVYERRPVLDRDRPDMFRS